MKDFIKARQLSRGLDRIRNATSQRGARRAVREIVTRYDLSPNEKHLVQCERSRSKSRLRDLRSVTAYTDHDMSF